MTIERIQEDMISALKSGEKQKKEALSSLVAAIKKAAIDEGCRDNIHEELTDKVILKEIKSIKEQIDTCPENRTDLLEEYKFNLSIIEKYAPKLMSENEIISELEDKFKDILATKNKGNIMKSVMPNFKGRADGKLVNQIIQRYL